MTPYPLCTMNVICEWSLKAPLPRLSLPWAPWSLSDLKSSSHLSLLLPLWKGRNLLLGWQVLSDNPPNSKFRFIEGASSISNFHKVPQEGSINALFPSCMSSSSLISVRLPYVVQEMFYHLGIVVKCWQVTRLLFLCRRTECHKVSPR